MQVATDSHRAYLDAVEGAFGMDMDHAMLHKIYGAPSDEEVRRYCPARRIGCDMIVVTGNSDPKDVSISYVERQNLTMRMSIRRFGRWKHGLADHVWSIEEMIALLPEANATKRGSYKKKFKLTHYPIIRLTATSFDW